LAGHCVFDYANNGGDDGACYTAADRLTKQLTDVDAAGRTLKNRQQYSKQRAAARAAKCAGNGVSDCAEVNILDSSAGRIVISPFLVFQMDYSGYCRASQQNLQVGYFAFGFRA
jgi:hypothetical protein